MNFFGHNFLSDKRAKLHQIMTELSNFAQVGVDFSTFYIYIFQGLS